MLPTATILENTPPTPSRFPLSISLPRVKNSRQRSHIELLRTPQHRRLLHRLPPMRHNAARPRDAGQGDDNMGLEPSELCRAGTRTGQQRWPRGPARRSSCRRSRRGRSRGRSGAGCAALLILLTGILGMLREGRVDHSEDELAPGVLRLVHAVAVAEEALLLGFDGADDCWYVFRGADACVLSVGQVYSTYQAHYI